MNRDSVRKLFEQSLSNSDIFYDEMSTQYIPHIHLSGTRLKAANNAAYVVNLRWTGFQRGVASMQEEIGLTIGALQVSNAERDDMKERVRQLQAEVEALKCSLTEAFEFISVRMNSAAGSDLANEIEAVLAKFEPPKE
jgi:peptidoglycan hydrolase CwlO-like protein